LRFAESESLRFRMHIALPSCPLGPWGSIECWSGASIVPAPCSSLLADSARVWEPFLSASHLPKSLPPCCCTFCGWLADWLVACVGFFSNVCTHHHTTARMTVQAWFRWSLVVVGNSPTTTTAPTTHPPTHRHKQPHNTHTHTRPLHTQRTPPELKHLTKARKRNQPGFD